jgi:hypothetical protein
MSRSIMLVRAVSLIVLTWVFLLASSLPAPAAARLSLSACRNLVFRDTGQGVHPTPVSCGREFPTSLPYVVLWLLLEDLDMATTLGWQLVDPGDEVYEKGQMRAEAPNQYYVWTIYAYLVLPVAAAAKDIVEQNPRFRSNIIEVGAKPISEMPGAWKLRTTLNGRNSGTLTFTLKP